MAKTPEAIQMLKEDHRKVKDLFAKFEDSDNKEEQAQIAQKVIQELTVHAELEEELFYPAVRQEIEEDELMNEAEEEHHVAKMLIEEIKGMDPSDEKFEAKVIVLAENIRHHIKEEEGEMLPKAQKTDIDFEELAQRMMQRKNELMEQVGAEPEMEAVETKPRARGRKAA